MSSSPLVRVSPQGLYCPAGDFYIDPWEPVATAVLTHAHSDHARAGSGLYHATEISRRLLKRRLGADARLQLHPYGESFTLGDVTVSLHPAGHILGSAQVRLEYEGEVWVISGDYKRQLDPTCAPFEVVPCDVLITEATFGLPIYHWPPTEQVATDILSWWQENRERGRNSLLGCYALGKAQRLLAALGEQSQEMIYTHGATEALVTAYREEGIHLPPTSLAFDAERPDATKLKGALILAPPSALGSAWSKRFGDAETGFASGWMQLRGQRKRRGYDRGFVLSDHADWSALLTSIASSEARKVYVTHGYSEELARHLREGGVDAQPLSTLFEGEGDS